MRCNETKNLDIDLIELKIKCVQVENQFIKYTKIINAI